MSNLKKEILLIVEGDGDVRAAPVLTRRILQERFGRYDIAIKSPQRRGDIHAVKRGFSKFAQVAMLEQVPVLWLLDCDDDDWQVCLSALSDLANNEHLPYPLSFAFIVKEYESLFLAEQNCLKQAFRLKESPIFDRSAESVRGAKEWISKHLPIGTSYKETVHQEKLSAQLSLDKLALNSPSYQRLEQTLSDLISHIPE